MAEQHKKTRARQQSGLWVMAIVALAIGAGGFPRLSQAGKYALVIGVSKYDITSENSGVKPLKYAAADAGAIKEILEQQGYRVVDVLTDDKAERTQILKAFAALQRDLTRDDIFLLFFAGHGLRDPRNGVTYWITANTELTLIEENGIRLGSIFNYVAELKASEKLVLLDHCFSGDIVYPDKAAGVDRAPGDAGLTVNRGGTMDVSDFEAQLGPMPAGVVYLAASAEKAYESDKLKQGLFTEALRRALTTRAAAQKDESVLSLGALITFVDKELETLADDAKVPQRLVSMKRSVVNEARWKTTFTLPLPGTEAERESKHALEFIDYWWGKEVITLKVRVESRTAMNKWVAFRLKETESQKTGAKMTEVLDPKIKTLVGRVFEHVKYADEVIKRDASPDSAIEVARALQDAMKELLP